MSHQLRSTYPHVIVRASLAFAMALLPAMVAAQAPGQVPQNSDPGTRTGTGTGTATADTPAKPAETPAKKDGDGQMTAAGTARPPKALPSKMSRWIEFQAGTLATRYRSIENSKSVRTTNQWQYSGQFRTRIKFDPKGRFSVNALFATGGGFTSGWNNTGVGTGEAARMWPLKHLYVAAVPTPGVEASFGSIGFIRGESTEITTWDNDGYMSGERVSVKRPKSFYFDELSVTSAFLGDTAIPAFWDRYDSLWEGRNYFQYFASKKVTKTVSASADYTRYLGVGTFRAGVGAKTPKARVVDNIRYEQYVRGGSKPGKGFAVFADKGVHKRVTIGAGFATIDPGYGTLNADRFGKGKRVYQTASVKVTPELTFQIFTTQAFDNAYAIPNRFRVDVIANYNVLGAIQRAGHLK